jgi:hypothetical protein
MQTILIIINHDYKAVIDPYSYHHIIMKFIILRLKHSEQAITHIRGWRGDSNQYSTLQGITRQHDTRRSEEHHEWQPFTTRSRSQAGSYLTLLSSSMRMPRRTHCGWPDTIPYNIHKEVGYHPTQRHAKLLSLGDSICPLCASTFNACSSGLNRRGP